MTLYLYCPPDQELDYLGVAPGAGEVQGGEVVVVADLDAHPGVYQQLQPVVVVVHDGLVHAPRQRALVLVYVLQLALLQLGHKCQ